MTTLYLFIGSITYLLVSFNQVTVLHFEEGIDRYIYGGKEADLQFTIQGDGKTLAIRPIKKDRLSNLIVFTKDKTFNFHFKLQAKDYLEFADIRLAKKNSRYQLFKSTKNYDLYEGESSLLIQNKLQNPILINGQKVERQNYFSKAPLFYKEEQLYP